MSKQSRGLKFRVLGRTRQGRITAVSFLVLTVLAALAITSNQVIEYKVNKFLGTSLVDIINNEYDQDYTISYDTLSINYWSSRVTISDVNLQWEGENRGEISDGDRLLNGGASKIYLDLDGIWKLWLQDYLSINRLTVYKPEIKVILRDKKPKTVSAQTGDFLKVIRKQLDIFEIEFLKIENASLEFYSQTEEGLIKVFNMPDVSLNLSDFEWELAQKLEGITTDDFQVTVKNQHVALQDSTLEVNFETLNYSLDQNRIAFSNVAIHTVPTKSTSKEDIIDVYLDGLELTGIDLQNAYNTNELNLETLKFESPKITWKRFKGFKNRDQRADAFTNNKIIYGLSSLFDRVSLPKLQFSNASVNFQLRQTSVDSVKIGRLNMAVHDMLIDNLVKGQSSFEYNSENFEIEAFDVESSLGIADHAIKASYLNYSFIDNLLKLDSLQIQPKTGSNSKRDFRLNLEIPKLGMYGINHRSIVNRKMAARLIELPKAFIDLKIYTAPTSKVEEPIRPDMNSLAKKYFDLATIEEINLNHINLNFENFDKTKVTLNKAGVALKSVNLLHIDSLIENSTVFKVNLPKVAVFSPKNNLEIKSENVNVDIRSGTLSAGETNYEQDNTMLSFEKIDVDELSLNDWYEKDSIYIKMLAIDQYKLSHVAKQDNKKLDLRLTIDSLSLTNGEVNLRSDTTDVSFTPTQLLASNMIVNPSQTSVEGYWINLLDFALNKDQMFLKLNSLDINSDNRSVLVKGLRYQQEQQDNTTLSIPTLSLSSFDLNVVLRGSFNLLTSRLKIDKPKLKRVDGNLAANYPVQDLSLEKMLSSLPDIRLKSISIVKGAFESFSLDSRLQVKDFNLTLNNVNTYNQWTSESNQFLFAKNISGEIPTFLWEKNGSSLRVSNVKIGDNNSVEGRDFSYYQTSGDSVLLGFQRFRMDGLAYNDVLFNDEINLNKLILSSPQLEVAMQKGKKSKATTFPHIHIKEAEINEASILVYTTENQKIDLDPVSIALKNIQYDSTIDLNTTLVPAEYISLTSQDLEWTSGNGLDKVKVGKVSLLNKENTTVLEDITLQPLFSQHDYMEKVGHETDWIEGKIPKITIKGMNFKRFLQEKAILSEEIRIHKPTLNIYRDKNMLDEFFPKTKSLPGTMIKSLKAPVDVDSLVIQDGLLVYQEIAEKGIEPGVFTLSDFNAQMKNMTNIPAKIASDSTMHLDIQAKVMGEIDFDINLDFYLGRDNDEFDISGSLSQNDMLLFNPVTEGAAFLRIKSGNCRSLEFSAHANDQVGYGRMYFQYNNLKVALVDKQTNDTRKIEESVASFFANTLIIKKNNLSLIKLRRGDIYFERNRKKSIFNYMSKLFMSGIYSSVGYKNYRKKIKELTGTKRKK